MTWGGIRYFGKTEILILNQSTVSAQSYIDNIVRSHVIPSARQVGLKFILMQDDGRPHTYSSGYRANRLNWKTLLSQYCSGQQILQI